MHFQGMILFKCTPRTSPIEDEVGGHAKSYLGEGRRKELMNLAEKPQTAQFLSLVLLESRAGLIVECGGLQAWDRLKRCMYMDGCRRLFVVNRQ